MLDDTQNPAAGQADKPDNLIEAAAAAAAMVGKPSTWPGIDGFAEHLWGGAQRQTGGLLWTAAFRTVRGGENWQGRPGLDWMRQAFPTLEADMYVSIALMRAGSTGRSNGNVVAQPVLIVDDVGTKVDPAKWEALFEAGCPRPTAQVETSPGNQTWFWLLDGDPTTPERFADLRTTRAWLVEGELTDRVMDAPRYVRLPGGWNSKPHHRGEDGAGDPPRVKLVAWRPGAVSFEALASVVVGVTSGAGVAGWRGAGLPSGAAARAVLSGSQLVGSGALVRCADLGKPDALMRLGDELGMALVQRGQGVVEALCPNIAQHTTRVDTGFAFLGNGLMHCNHASCQGLSTVDFRSMMMDQYSDRQAGRAIVGALTAGEPVTGEEFMARETFRDSGALDDADDVAGLTDAMTQNRLESVKREARGEAESGKRKRAQHEIALDLMALNGIVSYTDRQNGGVLVCVDGRWVNLSWASGFSVLMGWLARQGLTVTGTARKNLSETLEAIACAREPIAVSYRVSTSGPSNNPTIHYNLMDAENRVIEVSRSGWQVVKVSDAPVVLMHRPGGLPQVMPVRANDGVSFLTRLLRHIPLAPVLRPTDPNDEGIMQRAALLTFFIAQFVRWGAVPHLLLSGEQGGGKTTIARRINSASDPDAGSVLSRLAPDEAGVFAQLCQLSNVILDNSSGVSNELADVLCCLATGAAHSARRLYTNGERTLSSALCSVVFTSVLDGISRRPDLLDRTLVLATAPLPKDKRRSESELDAAWAADLPNLMADLFDLLSIGLKHVGDIRAAQRGGFFPPPPRFADVAQVAEAAAWHGLGWPAGLLTRALNNLRAAAADDQLTEDPIAYRLRELLRQQPGGIWRGSYDDLGRVLGVMDGPFWDRNRITLKGGYARIKGPLRDRWGIHCKDGKRTKHSRIFEWHLQPETTDEAEKSD